MMVANNLVFVANVEGNLPMYSKIKVRFPEDLYQLLRDSLALVISVHYITSKY